MRATYPFLFEDEGAWSNIWLEYYCICMCLCVLVCVNFRDKIMLRGEECKTQEIRNLQKRTNDINNNKLSKWFREA